MESFANRRAFWQVENMGISGSDTLFSRIFVSKHPSVLRGFPGKIREPWGFGFGPVALFILKTLACNQGPPNQPFEKIAARASI